MRFRLLSLLLILFSSKLIAQTLAPHAENQLIVKIADSVPFYFDQTSKNFNHPIIDSLNQHYKLKAITAMARPKAYQSKKKTRPATHRLFLFQFGESRNLQKLLNTYFSTGLFEYLEPNYKGLGSGFFGSTPNDEFFNRQWGLLNDGTFHSSSKADADIDMDEAWDISTGNPEMITAILDTGVKLDHPEVKNRVWQNTGEVPNNGMDDDNNGFADDHKAWDFVNEDESPQDDHGHGSNVTSILAASGNNGVGYAGVDWNCQLMILKVLDRNNLGFYFDWVRAIYYAVDHGAKVINLSAGGTGVSSSLLEAVNYATENGVVIVCSMMNSGDDTRYYPAAYANTIAVGATTYNDRRTSFSNIGPHIDLLAPGEKIYGMSKNDDDNYNLHWTGTSMASPHVAGVASLLMGLDSSLNLAKIRTILRTTAEDQIGDPEEDIFGWDQFYGAGRLNAAEALSTIATAQQKPDLQMKNLSRLSSEEAGSTAYFTFDLINNGPGIVNGNYTIGAYLSKTATISPDAMLAGTIPVSYTAVGTIAEVQGTITIPENVEGTYFLVLKADTANSIFETNEDNNLLARNFQFININDPLNKGIDLELSVTVNSTALNIYQTYRLNYIIQNKGKEQADSIKVEILYPDGMAYDSHQSSLGNYIPWNNFIWEVATLEGGAQANLEIILFSLQETEPITVWGQVKSMKGKDIDSDPDNAICCDFIEDDESGVVIGLPCEVDTDGDGVCEELDNCPDIANPDQLDSNNNGIGDICEIIQEGSIDLELELSLNKSSYQIYENYIFTLRLSNKGPKKATNVSVQFILPEEMAYTSHQTSKGQYINWKDFLWVVGSIEADESVTLEVTLFSLVNEGVIKAYTQVITAEGGDVDSRPKNGNGITALEDDEAAARLYPVDGIGAGADNAKKLKKAAKIYSLYPNPTAKSIRLIIQSSTLLSLELQFYDIQGILVETKNINLNTTANIFEFNVQHLKDGLYQIMMLDHNKRHLQSVRFLKQNL